MTTDIIVQSAPKAQDKKRPFESMMQLYEQGYSLVPTARNKTKRPIIKGWKEYQERQPTPDEVRSWNVKDCNWAIVTGKQPKSKLATATCVGVIIADADDQEAIELIESRCDKTPLWQVTHDGRRQYVYRHPGRYVMTRNKIEVDGEETNIDIKGDGGQCHIPWSIHYSGCRYTPNQEWTAEAIASCPVYDPDWFPEPKDDWEEAETHIEAIEKISLPIGERIKQAQEWLETQPGTTVGQGADNRCFAIAMTLVWGFGLDQESAIEIFIEWGERGDQYDESGDYFCWTEKQLRHKLKTAAKKSYHGSIGDKIDEMQWLTQQVDQLQFCDLTEYIKLQPKEEVTTPEPKTELVEVHKSVSTMMGWSDMKAEAATQNEDWLIKDWLEFGSVAMLNGDPFSGKSCIVAELIASISKYREFGNYEVPCCPIMLIDLENKTKKIVTRLLRCLEGDETSLDGKIARSNFQEDFLPLTPAKIETIIKATMPHFANREHLFSTMKPFVIVDTLRSAFQESEMDSDQMKNLLYPLQRVAQRTDAAILILHHRPKNGAAYSGQTSIAGALDFQWMWQSDRETRIGNLSLIGTRGDIQPPMRFLLNERNRNVFTTEPSENILEDCLRVALSAGPLNQERLVTELRNCWSSNSVPSKTKMRDFLAKEVEAASLITCITGPNNSKVFQLIGG